jgi:hypothetical protein
MPLTTADVPSPDKPEPKPEPKPKSAPPAKTGLADAAASTDPLVQKLMWDRGHRDSSGDAGRVATIDAELRKLGFDF